MAGREARRIINLTAAGLLLLGATADLSAQHGGDVSVAGKWEITLQNDAQSYEWNVTFEQDGVMLSGFAEMQGRVFPLEGSLDGQKITFAVMVDDPGHDAPLMFTGDVDGHTGSGVMDPTNGMHSDALMDWVGEKTDP